jgi:hypothetical protein
LLQQRFSTGDKSQSMPDLAAVWRSIACLDLLCSCQPARHCALGAEALA